jgi:hypothetical protein
MCITIIADCFISTSSVPLLYYKYYYYYNSKLQFANSSDSSFSGKSLFVNKTKSCSLGEAKERKRKFQLEREREK